MSRRRKNSTTKSPTLTPGANQAGISPNAGFNGQLTVSPSRGVGTRDGSAGDIPPNSRGGSQWDAPRAQPPDQISDVSANNWFSPFQPVTPFGPPWIQRPREWDYQVGQNLQYQPARFYLYEQLRQMSRSWGVLRTIIETRKDQLLRTPWNFRVIGAPTEEDPRMDELRRFFRRPDGKRSFNNWARLILEDLFVIDAPAIYIGERNRKGQPMFLQVLDGARIKVLIDDLGRIPDWPQPAYQQITKGQPMVNLTEREVIYAPMRPTTDMPIYGFSPVEQIYIEVTEAIKKTMYQLNFWTEGNLPDMIMSVPKEWTATQIATFQALFDAELSGNLLQKSKVRFVPEGMTPYDVKGSAGENVTTKRDEALIRLACFAFSVAPTPFIDGSNRSVAETMQREAVSEGLHPLQAWFRDDIMNRIIWEEFGYEDIEFVWQPTPEVDQLKRAQVANTYVRGAMMTINEARKQSGEPPVKNGDEILIYTNNGVMTLEDALEMSRITVKRAREAPSPQEMADMGMNIPGRPGNGKNSGNTEGGAKDGEKQQGSKQDVSEQAEGS